jgi:uncharacterized protein YkwD
MVKKLLVYLLALIFIVGLANVGLSVLETKPDNNRNSDDKITKKINSGDEVNLNKVEELLHKKTNEQRQQASSEKVQYDTRVYELANYKSDKMVHLDYISHTSPDGESLEDRIEKFDLSCYRYGENLAKTYYNKRVKTDFNGIQVYNTEEELADGIITQLMNSPSHKQNLLDNDWDAQGISVNMTENNKVYAAQNFCEFS